MAGLTDTFGVSLKAYTDLDKSSLDRATKSVGDAFGKAYSGSGKSAGGAQAAIKAGTQETARFGATISRVRESLSATWHTTGLGKAVEQLRDAKEAAREFHHQAEKTGRLFGLGREVFALAGIGGLGLALQSYASRSVELSNTAGTFGVSTSMLQRYRGAAGLSGLDPNAATSAIGGLQQSLFGAQWGTNAAALGAANRLGLNVYEDPGLFMRHLADKIKGEAPQVQREIAEAFGVQSLLPLLRKGSQGIDELNAAAARHRELTDDQIKQGKALGEAYEATTQSTLGFADALAAHLSPSLTPLLTDYSKWLDDLKKSPDALDKVGKGVEIFAGLVGVTLVSAFAKLAWAMTSWWASPAMTFLASPTGLAVLAGTAAMAGFYESKDWVKSQLPISHSGPLANRPNMAKPGHTFLDNISNWWHDLGSKPVKHYGPRSEATGQVSPGPGSANDPRGMIPVIRAAAAKYDVDPDIAVRVAQSEGLFNYVGDKGTSFGSFQLHYGGLADQFRKDTGLDPSDPKNETRMIDWSMQNAAKTGWGPYHGAAVAGIADRQGIGAYPGDRGLSATTLADKLRRDGALNWGPSPFAVPGHVAGDLGQYIPAMAADTHHQVEIIAPPGFQAAARMAKGPAELTLRTQTAFSTP